MFRTEIYHKILIHEYAGALRPGQARNTRLCIYCGILATRGGTAHFIYAVTVQTPRPEQGRHTQLLSYV
jgi:hypothetical protein